MYFQFQNQARQQALEEIASGELEREIKSPLWKNLLKSSLACTVPVGLAGLLGVISGHGNGEAIQNMSAMLPLYPVWLSFSVLDSLGKKNPQVKSSKITGKINSIKEALEGKTPNFPEMAAQASITSCVYLTCGYLSKALGIASDFSNAALIATGLLYGIGNHFYTAGINLGLAEKVRKRARIIQEELISEDYANAQREAERRRRKMDEEFEKLFEKIREKIYSNPRNSTGNRANSGSQTDYRNPESNTRDFPPRVIRNGMTYVEAIRIMGLRTDASYAEARTKYHELAMKYHPHRNPGNKSAENNFKKIADAWKIVFAELNPDKANQ